MSKVQNPLKQTDFGPWTLDIGLWTFYTPPMPKKRITNTVRVGLIQMSCEERPEANFKKAVLPKVTVTVGQAAELNDIALEPGQISESVTISDATSEIVETSKTAVSTTIDQQRIDSFD